MYLFTCRDDGNGVVYFQEDQKKQWIMNPYIYKGNVKTSITHYGILQRCISGADLRRSPTCSCSPSGGPAGCSRASEHAHQYEKALHHAQGDVADAVASAGDSFQAKRTGSCTGGRSATRGQRGGRG